MKSFTQCTEQSRLGLSSYLAILAFPLFVVILSSLLYNSSVKKLLAILIRICDVAMLMHCMMGKARPAKCLKMALSTHPKH